MAILMIIESNEYWHFFFSTLLWCISSLAVVLSNQETSNWNVMRRFSSYSPEASRMPAIPNWTLSPDGTRISRCFVAKNWAAALKFFNQVGEHESERWCFFRVFQTKTHYPEGKSPEIHPKHFSKKHFPGSELLRFVWDFSGERGGRSWRSPSGFSSHLLPKRSGRQVWAVGHIGPVTKNLPALQSTIFVEDLS